MSFLAHRGKDGSIRLGNAPRPPGFPWKRIALLLALLVILACCASCTQEERQAQVASHRVRKTREEPTATGGKVTLEEEWTDTEEHAITTRGLDDQWSQVAQAGVGVVKAAATGDWTDVAIKGVAALSLAAAAWNAKGSQSANRRADEHKADADAGWSKFEQATKAGA